MLLVYKENSLGVRSFAYWVVRFLEIRFVYLVGSLDICVFACLAACLLVVLFM